MSVQAQIHTRNITLNDHLATYIEKKVAKLTRYLPDLKHAEVDLVSNESARNSNDRQIAQLTVRARGAILRAEEKSSDLQAAFDLALDKLQRQIERYKGKRQHNPGERSIDDGLPAEVPLPATADLVPPPTVLRRKKFALSPMTEEEAIEQMSLLGHDNFFVFYNAETDKVNVLYKRSNGYGLIDTDMA
jgi:putative sigma-54 modulation protein